MILIYKAFKIIKFVRPREKYLFNKEVTKLASSNRLMNH